jgi:hypothetical protein
MKQKLIYMPLLNEETTVSRPVVASDMGSNIYKMIQILIGRFLLEQVHLEYFKE